MKNTFYKKVGRRYIPVSEYDNEVCDAFPKGSHLVQCYPGGSLRRYNIDPAYAPMIAAGRIAEETISMALMQAGQLRPKSKPLTRRQKEAWEDLVKAFGPEARVLEWPSAREVAEEAVKAMEKEAEELMKHPAVKQAYEQFQLVCELTKQHQI